MNRKIFKLCFLIFDILVCYLVKDIYEFKTLAFLQSLAYTNFILLSFIFVCYGLFKSAIIIDSFLNKAYNEAIQHSNENKIKKLKLDIELALQEENYEKVLKLQLLLKKRIKK